MITNWGNINDYLTWRGDLTFQSNPFNMVDGLIFANFSYINFPESKEGDTVPFYKKVAELEMLSEDERFKGLGLMREKSLQFVKDAAATMRFRNLLMTGIVSVLCEDTQQQFYAVTFLLPDQTMYIAFRGTDNTLVGWKEDFNMAFMKETPSQREAAKYVRKMASLYDYPMRIGGHSKGGNLAVWAAANFPSEKKERILQVCNYDGPGFLPEFVQSEGYKEISSRIFSFVPESSIVGVLMSHCDYLTVKSTTHSIMQHDPFSWKIAGKRFEYDIERSKSGRKLEKAINKLLGSMTPEEIEDYVDRIYDTLKKYDAKTLDDLQKNRLRHIFFTLPKLVKLRRRSSNKRAEAAEDAVR